MKQFFRMERQNQMPLIKVRFILILLGRVKPQTKYLNTTLLLSIKSLRYFNIIYLLSQCNCINLTSLCSFWLSTFFVRSCLFFNTNRFLDLLLTYSFQFLWSSANSIVSSFRFFKYSKRFRITLTKSNKIVN